MQTKNFKTKTEYKVNKGQIARIHILLGKLHMDKDELAEYKTKLVKEYTSDRETSTTMLSWKEANDMIAALERMTAVSYTAEEPVEKQGTPADRKRKKLLHYCHLMGWYEGINTAAVDRAGAYGVKTYAPVSRKLDMERVDGWCMKYGKFHKALNEHTSEELSVLIVQMEEVYKSLLNSI